MAEYLSKEELENYFGREYLTIYEMFNFGPDDYIQHWYKDEIWTRIIGLEDYWISNKGRVWSERKQIMLRHKIGDSHGHWSVGLTVNYKTHNLYVHRLIAIHFVPNPNDYPIVCHINDNKNNNCISNLTWGTYSENLYSALENGCRERIGGGVKPVISINTDIGEARYFISMKRLGDYLNVSRAYVSISTNKGWKVKGYRVYDANDFNLPPGLQDGDIVDLEVLYEN